MLRKGFVLVLMVLIFLLPSCSGESIGHTDDTVSRQVYDELLRKYDKLFAIQNSDKNIQEEVFVSSEMTLNIEVAVNGQGKAYCMLSYTGGPEQLTIFYTGNTPIRWDVYFADGDVQLPYVINSISRELVLKRDVPYCEQFQSYILDEKTGEIKKDPDREIEYEKPFVSGDIITVKAEFSFSKNSPEIVNLEKTIVVDLE